MPSEIIAFTDQPNLLLAGLVVGVVVGIAVEKIRSAMRRRAWLKRKQRWDKTPARGGSNQTQQAARPEPSTSKQPDAADQLRVVMGADFTVQLLLNRSEALLKELDRIVLSLKPGWQVMAQVSLGEILRCKDPAAYRCINSKRVDLLLVDETCQPRHALECQGGGHHQGTAAERDAGQERGSATSQHRPPRSGFGAHNTLGLKRSADSFHDWHLGFFVGMTPRPSKRLSRPHSTVWFCAASWQRSPTATL